LGIKVSEVALSMAPPELSTLSPVVTVTFAGILASISTSGAKVFLSSRSKISVVNATLVPGFSSHCTKLSHCKPAES
jgi:hypothetical protein